MAWPLSQDYNEAIQAPAANFADADLRRGEAAVNALGIPMPYSGNFADVYQVRCPDGGRWAVKCFTRQAVGLRDRYQEISRHLRQAALPFTVDFTYLDQGIRVAGKWYPVLKMQWVEGMTLNQFVGQHLDRPAMLEALLPMWGRMAQYLRDAEVGHCDLQHGNVLLTPGASANTVALKLIDYDGMWAPALAGKKSGEIGHPCYQHPQRLRDGTYNMDVDRFPLLLIATGLRALKVQGRSLWEKYDNGDNLLFKQADLDAPTRSFLFRDLIRSADPLTVTLADHLLQALRGGLASAPALQDVLPKTGLTSAPGLLPRMPPLASPVAAGRSAVLVAAPVAPGRPPQPLIRAPAARKTPGRRRRRRSSALAVGVVVGVVFAALLGVGAYFLLGYKPAVDPARQIASAPPSPIEAARPSERPRDPLDDKPPAQPPDKKPPADPPDSKPPSPDKPPPDTPNAVALPTGPLDRKPPRDRPERKPPAIDGRVAVAGPAPGDRPANPGHGKPPPADMPPAVDVAVERAVTAVEKLGGKVRRDDHSPGRPVIAVDLAHTPAKDADLKELAALKGLESLDLAHTAVTDAGLKELADLKGLRILYLSGAPVTDAGLMALAEHVKGLQQLYLSDTLVTDASLKDLADLKALQTLNLSLTKTTDAGVAELQKALPACKIIH